MASMALFDFARPSLVDSDRPMSHSSTCSASSHSLISSIASSDLEDYYSCADDMAAELDEFSEELNFLLDVEAEEQPSTVFIYSANASPDASSNSSPCPPSSVPLIQPLTADHAMQSEERDFFRLSEWATMVVWDPHLPGTFPLDSNTSILPPWWRGEECHGTFGYPAFTRLSKPVSFAGRFAQGDAHSDDMEGRPVWDPSVPETLRERAC